MSSIYVVFGMFVKATEQNRTRTLDEWARLAQFKNPKRIPDEVWPSPFTDNVDNLYGKWSVADLLAYCCLEDYGDCFCFQIFAHWNDVSDYGLPSWKVILDGDPEKVDRFLIEEPSFYKDPRVQIAEDFARACVAIGAEVGVYTQTEGYKPSYREMQEWLKEYVYDRAIRIGDARALFNSSWRVLFLNDELYSLLLKQYPGVYVDELLWVTDVIPGIPPGSHGALLFQGRGRYRF